MDEAVLLPDERVGLRITGDGGFSVSPNVRDLEQNYPVNQDDTSIVPMLLRR